MELFPDHAKGPAEDIPDACRDGDQQQGCADMERLNP